MCGRFGLWASSKLLIDHFQLQLPLPLTPRYNIAPSQEILAIGKNQEEERKAANFRWGLVPHWAKDTNIGYKMINARAENLFSKPAFKSAARKRRCLIPASCFFEWKRQDKGPKQPYCIIPKESELFAFAGIWERWKNPDTDQNIYSCSIVTTKANEVIQPLHDRMPVIITRENFDLFLDWHIKDQKQLGHLLEPISSRMVNLYKVGSQVNKPANDSEEVIQPI